MAGHVGLIASIRSIASHKRKRGSEVRKASDEVMYVPVPSHVSNVWEVYWAKCALDFSDEADDCDSGSCCLLWEVVLSPLLNLEHFCSSVLYRVGKEESEERRRRKHQQEDANVNRELCTLDFSFLGLFRLYVTRTTLSTIAHQGDLNPEWPATRASPRHHLALPH